MRPWISTFAAIAILAVASYGEPDALSKLNENAAPVYRQQYHKMLESGELEPRGEEIPQHFAKDSPERRYWLAGYLSALVEYINPKCVTDRTEPSGIVDFAGGGAERWYAEGHHRGMIKADRIARPLYKKIVVGILNLSDEESARRQKQQKKK